MLRNRSISIAQFSHFLSGKKEKLSLRGSGKEVMANSRVEGSKTHSDHVHPVYLEAQAMSVSKFERDRQVPGERDRQVPGTCCPSVIEILAGTLIDPHEVARADRFSDEMYGNDLRGSKISAHENQRRLLLTTTEFVLKATIAGTSFVAIRPWVFFGCCDYC